MKMTLVLGKAVRLKIPRMLFFILFVSLYIVGSLYWIFTQNSLSEVSFLETTKCPLCYGNSMCRTLLNNKIILNGISKVKSFDFRNSKNVYFAKHADDDQSLVIKKLANNHDFNDLDAKICRDSNMAPGCDITSAIKFSTLVKDIANDDLFAKHLQGTSPMFACTSTRLLGNIFNNYREKLSPGQITTADKIQILTTARLNAEPLLLQTKDGWPFPKYHGACGRYVIVSHAGRPLSEFYSSSWTKRVDLAYQMLKIADQLTNNIFEYALYLTDVTEDNFVVDESGKVTVIDLEDILVVDLKAIKEAKLAGWDDLLESTFAECPDQTLKSCHSFSQTQLCSHVTSDHNYYSICRYILLQYTDDSGLKGQSQNGGLLHDIPETAKNDWDLEYLLNECVIPKRQRGRIQVVHKLIDVLDNIRQKEEN